MTAPDPVGRLLPARGLRVAWWALLAGVVVDRIRLMAHFSWLYTDKDQTLLWTGAYEMMHLRFHEPRWYGQDYNTLLESLLAAPLVALELPYAVALPLASSLLCLAPFVLLSACARRAGWVVSAFAVLATPLLLPIRYGMLTSIPRGFVTGMVFAAIPACLMLFRLSPARWFACGFLLVFSLSINPSAAILAVPVGLRLLFEHGASRHLRRYGGAGALVASGLHVLSVGFYRFSPAHVVYGRDLPPILAFDLALLGDNALHAARYLGDVSPALPGGVALAALLFGATLWGLARRGAGRFALALAAGGALTLFSLGLERLAGGSESVLWPWSRNYLSVPLLIGTGLIWLEAARAREPAPSRVPVLALLAVAWVGFFAVRFVTLEDQIERHLQVRNPVGVKPWSVEKVGARCADLVERAARHDAELIVFRNKHKILSYACEALHDGRVKTLLIRPRVPERRTWRLVEEARRPARGALLYNFQPEQIAGGRSLGLEAGEPEDLAGIRIDPVRLPPGREAFELFVAMEVAGASDLVRRLDLLGVR